MQTNPNDPASSHTSYYTSRVDGQEVPDERFPGLTKRELFAAMAMPPLIATNEVKFSEVIAKFSVAYADALIAELNRTEATK